MDRNIKIILIILASVLTPGGVVAQLSFVGSDRKVISEKPEASTGLDELFVIYNTSGVKAEYKAKSDDKVTWMRFSNLGGGFAEEITAERNGSTYTISLGSEDIGYIIEEGTTRHYYWVINYANHHAVFDNLQIAEDQECDRARLSFTGKADRISYFTINGASRQLSRDLVVEYNTLKYDEASDAYLQVPASQTLASIDESIGVFAPLCDTYFDLSGDRFLKEWGMQLSIESPYYKAIAVESRTKAEQDIRDVENEQKVDATLGGSAPVDITFHAVVTDAAIFREWQIARDAEFETIFDRFQELDFSYTFRENGNFFVRFVADNAGGTCEYVSETYEVFIGDSGLLCPNAFSPNGDGVNDEWRVSYKSIVEFECHIFNRWGQEMISMNNPAQGWDGKYHGKYVPTGVYYYVVKARGADGRKYNLNGDINIIHSKGHKEGASDAPVE